MKHSMIAIILTFFISNLVAQDCSRITSFGAAEICFPAIEGYEECYLEPQVKELADLLEIPSNEVLGFYLSDEIYEQRENLADVVFDDYFKIYATTQLKDYQASKKILKEMKKLLEGNFVTENWDDIHSEVDKIGVDVSIDSPRIIESYYLTDDSFTIVMLAKYEFEGMDPYMTVMTINGMLIDNRMVWMAYYLNYTDAESVEQVQVNSNEILTALLKASN